MAAISKGIKLGGGGILPILSSFLTFLEFSANPQSAFESEETAVGGEYILFGNKCLHIERLLRIRYIGVQNKFCICLFRISAYF